MEWPQVVPREVQAGYLDISSFKEWSGAAMGWEVVESLSLEVFKKISNVVLRDEV